MCGIAGFFGRSGESRSKALRASCELLKHRGPDYADFHELPGFGCAHTRLSILDLSPTGNQPITNGRQVLTYNGELYNHLDLRKELQSESVQFRGSSDTASLFAYLCRHGVEATLGQIRGMFAFAFFDSIERTLFLCRDRFGIKPLLYAQTPGGLVWASEAKALSPFMTLEPEPVQTLYGLFGVADHSAELTVFRGVKQIPPGHYLKCGPDGRCAIKQYYCLADHVDETYFRELQRLHKEEVVERFTSLLASGTRKMLMSDAPMGAFVSGGIDSSLIASFANPLHKGLKLFTADVVGTYSEYKDASLLAEHLGCELQASRFHPGQMISDWAQATWHYEMPIVTHTNSLPFASVARVARATGVKAILSGEGSDELFLGYPKLLTRRYDGLLKLPVDILMALYKIVPKLRDYILPRDGLKTFASGLVRNFEHPRFGERTRRKFDFLPAAVAREQHLTVEMFSSGLLALLHRNDRMGMSASIEARFPFLDEDLVHFGLNLPVKWKIGHSWRFHDYKHPFLEDKSVVRGAARRLLPPRLVQKVKCGFPMIGHKSIRVKTGFFQDGFVANLVGMNRQTEEYMTRTQPAYFVAKLASVEVFGRLFGMGHDIDAVTEHLRQWIDLSVADRDSIVATSAAVRGQNTA